MVTETHIKGHSTTKVTHFHQNLLGNNSAQNSFDHLQI